MTSLLIVESPAKAKTINKYLGNAYKVIASFGHIRDLPKKNGSIDVENDFAAKYQIVAKNKKHVDEILQNAKICDQILLATDPDREGEAIAWHINEVLHSQKGFNKPVKRVTFNEITGNAITDAVANPRELDYNLIDAQQARLTLDYLIGFNISPLLWRKIKPGLSAGRVQSPALRLICEREAEIKAFIPEDYFTLLLDSHKQANKFSAKLSMLDGKKIEAKTVNTKVMAAGICDQLSSEQTATVTNITKKQRGVDLGHDTVGLISYMRTDSVSLSSLAIDEIREYIENNYDLAYLPKSPVKYASKVKNAQEAHEAIRPTSILRTPDSLKKYLSPDQYRLYELIWLRTLACQFNPAILDTTAVDIKVGNAIFRLNGLTVNFDGFMKVYQETFEDSINEDEESAKLPALEVDEKLPVDKIYFTEHQTEPKPRYSEASLVKTLEELGIGRPSTLVSIISTLKKREYVIMDKKRFIPTDTGSIVSQFLTNHMTRYVDFEFTANLEDTLDDISNGKTGKLPVLKEFWHTLEAAIAEKQNIARADLVTEKLDENCPECGKGLIVRLGKFGKFVGCSGYPECKYMRKIDKSGDASEPAPEPEVVEGRTCPKDDGILVIRSGRYGKFISCKNYPKCKFIENLDKPTEESGEKIVCPECKTGNIVAKKNRYGSWFYACDNYPKCKTLFNSPVIDEKCPKCDYPVILHKKTKTKGEQKSCPKCDYSENL
ncbi:MAG: type topoisomerase [Burkholderiales bacterium]|nr:type topoisomerase [Burkholderiales bacterium]